jgi:predicted nucleotidyltransferase component of viral defense system
LITPSAETLARLQRRWPFGLDTLETVVRLREVLRAVSEDAVLSNRLALKGGTALNLCFGPLPRLSVDLDFNDIGQASRTDAMADRPAVLDAIEQIARRGGYRVQRSREEHAGQKLYLGYDSVLGGQRRIEVDVNFLHRLPLAAPRKRTVWAPGDDAAVRCLVVAPAELLAGKILALLDRAAPRDLFDIAHLPPRLQKTLHDTRARRTFIALAGTLPHSLTKYGRQRFDRLVQRDVEQSLYPLLRQLDRPTAAELRTQAWTAVEPWLTLSDAEREYVERLQDGDFKPELLFSRDRKMIDRLERHPALQWKIQNARLHAKRSKNSRDLWG